MHKCFADLVGSAENDQPFFNRLDFYFNGSQQIIQLDQYSPNNNATVTSDNSLPVLYTPMTSFVHADLTSQSYPTMSYEAQYNFNNVSNEQVSIQNLLPYYMTTPSEIIIREIPGYDVIYIPRPNPFVNSNINSNMQQQDSTFLNSSPVISMQQQSYVSSGNSAGESPTNPIIIDP